MIVGVSSSFHAAVSVVGRTFRAGTDRWNECRWSPGQNDVAAPSVGNPRQKQDVLSHAYGESGEVEIVRSIKVRHLGGFPSRGCVRRDSQPRTSLVIWHAILDILPHAM